MDTKLLTAAIPTYISDESGIDRPRVQKAIDLFEEGATLPFIARYRKEATGGLDEIQLRHIQERYSYYQKLNERKVTVYNAINEQGKLTDAIAHTLKTCREKQAVEDVYLPFKTKRKTKADVAIENGFLPLAELIWAQKDTRSRAALLQAYTDAAFEGAIHILAQRIADTPNYRQWLRHKLMSTGVLSTKLSSKVRDEATKFDMYTSFSEPLHRAASHRLLAIRRGEREKIVQWKLLIDDDVALDYLEKQCINPPSFALSSMLKAAIADAYKRLLLPSLQTECFNMACANAEADSMTVFSKNLQNLLLTAPAGKKVIMGIDPGFRTGCKVAVVDQTGQFQQSATIYPTPPVEKRDEAEKQLLSYITQYAVDFIAIGNGTASKETMQFVKQMIKKHQLSTVPVIVNEAGASVYSASQIAIDEYPSLDVTIRGAISIAHRLQDPLSELVKIDPKSIGVGQYQHDINQTQLAETLTFTTESAVNAVGVDVNTASAALLRYVSGIGATLAKNIVQFRNEKGPFKARIALRNVPKLGPKAFEQCAGFLRIKMAQEPLDNSAIHPESYGIVSQMATALSTSTAALIGNDVTIEKLTLSDYVTDRVGLPTLQDIVSELKKPGLDPRAEFTYATFDDAIDDISDLTIGMALEGTVTNVTNFGAFVDIGVHQDGLIHISKLSRQFVKSPHDIVSVGDAIKVTVIDIDTERKRIQLSAVSA